MGYYRVSIPDGGTLVLGGLFTGPVSAGANYEVRIYDELENDLGTVLNGAAYGLEENDAEFTNTTGADADFFIHVDSNSINDVRELEDYRIDLSIAP